MDKSNIQLPNQNKNVLLLENSTRKNKPPVVVVRQTKASKLRAEQGNQLEYYKKQVEKYETDLRSNNKEVKASFKMPMSAVSTPSVVSQLNNNSTMTKTIKATSTVKLNQTALLRAKANEKKMNKSTKDPKIQVKIKMAPAVPNSTSNNNNKIEKQQQHSLRKSISARHLTNCNPNSGAIKQRTYPRRSSSWTSEPAELLFKTPTLRKRRSIMTHTPLNRAASVHLIPPLFSTSPCHELRKRLSVWLEKQGKPFGAYHHLRCFGLHKPSQVIDEEDKENCVLEAMKLSDSYEQLHIEEDVSVANDALFDLHKLIQEGYPRDQCEAWLQHICNNYQQVEDKPQYWECRAALQEALGDLTTALDCYKTALIKGAEVKQVDESLENLFKKFSVLNISPHLQPKAVNQSKARIIVDARNIFKSQIINFAIKERSKKHDQKDDTEKCKLIATPVRRSTRSSRSCYKTTPGIQVIPTLSELGSQVQFVTNKALK